jgi:hypothetical protein
MHIKKSTVKTVSADVEVDNEYCVAADPEVVWTFIFLIFFGVYILPPLT